MQLAGINLYQNFPEHTFAMKSLNNYHSLDSIKSQYDVSSYGNNHCAHSLFIFTFAASDNDAEFEGLPDVEDELDSDDDDDDDEGTKWTEI